MQRRNSLASFRNLLTLCGVAIALSHAPSVAAQQNSTRTAKSSAQASSSKSTRQAKQVSAKRRSVVQAAPERPSLGQVYGLHAVNDPLDLKSKCKNTPFDEARLDGRVVRTIVAGRTAYEYAST